MNKQDVVDLILNGKGRDPKESGESFAPVNIALCKYWGKRDTELNLPNTSSLSISLGALGAETEISVVETADAVQLNGQAVVADHPFYKRLAAYLDLIRPDEQTFYQVDTVSHVPVAAGLATSASGFCALATALDDLYGWGLNKQELSILSRLGSGSASRSVYPGFCKWIAGERDDGMDSYAVPIESSWPDLRIGLLILSEEHKPISSREAMKRTCETSVLYRKWAEKVTGDMESLLKAIDTKEIHRLGATAESNALAMHATMFDSRPPVIYWKPETLEQIHKIHALQAEDLALYFTMDAGPNVKLIFEEKDEEIVRQHFPDVQIVAPFEKDLKG